jgi:murein DD-endopeptidase MepM/ murein hydrolase activator NlpD
MRTLPSLSRQNSKMLKLGGQLSAMALIAGLGACSSSPFNLREPVFTGSTANQQAILSGQPGAGPAGVSTGIQSSDLPPPPGGPAPVYAGAPPQGYIPPKPYAAAGLPTPVGQVNAPGQGLAQLGPAPTSLSEQAPSIGGASGTHTVQAGDTMYNIARRYGVSVDALIAANGSSVARLGQRVKIPGGGAAPEPEVQSAAVNPRAVPTPEPAVLTTSPPLGLPPSAAELPQPAPAAPQVALAPQTGAAASQLPAPPQATPAPQEQSTAESGFRWPVRGRVISEFGKKPNGERNDGINLAVPEGTAVKAAEDGTVIYSGNELKSYGNLVLIRHEGGWVSAYAHNSELKVKRGEQVRRGQVVALSGMSGGVTTPQVHFELRKDATPVNPLQHLTES